MDNTALSREMHRIILKEIYILKVN